MAFAAPTNWNSGPKDDYMAIDPYRVKVGGMVNSIQDFAKKYNVDLASVIRGGSVAASLMPLFNKSGTFSVNKENLISRVLAGNRDVRNVLSQMPAGIADKAYSSFQEYGDVFAKVGDVVSRVQYTDFKDLSSVGYFINDMAGRVGDGVTQLFSMDDQDSTVGLIVGTIKEATRFGIPNSFGAITHMMESNATMNKIIKGVLPDAIRAGDIAMIADMSRSAHSGILMQCVPDIVNQMCTQYPGKYGSTDNDRIVQYGEFKETFSSIDELWDRKLRYTGVDDQGNPVGENVPSIVGMLGASDAFKEVSRIGSMVSDSISDKYNMLVDLYSKRDVVSDIKEQFPNSTIAFKGDNPQADPRLVAESYPITVQPSLNMSTF